MSLARDISFHRSVELALLDPQATPEYAEGVRAGLEAAAAHLENLSRSRLELTLIRLNPRRVLRETAGALRRARVP